MPTDAVELIQSFTDWRLGWYINRYERLLSLIQADIQRYKDILIAIKNNVGSIARKVESRANLIEFLQEIHIVNVDYIASLPVYRFTVEEREKTEAKLKLAYETERRYIELLANEDLRRDVYISELQAVQAKHCKK